MIPSTITIDVQERPLCMIERDVRIESDGVVHRVYRVIAGGHDAILAMHAALCVLCWLVPRPSRFGRITIEVRT
jgi:hypothetical protein